MSAEASKKSPAADPFMGVDENLHMTEGDLRGLAFLEEGPRSTGDAPAWLDQVLGGRLAVAICRPTRGVVPQNPPKNPQEIQWLATEEVAPGCFAIASEGDHVNALVAAVRAACAAGGLAAVTLGPGTVGRSMLLGPVPEAAAALFAERAAAGRTGVFVDEAVLAAVREPAIPQGSGFLLRATPAAPTRRWGVLAPVLAMAAAALLGFGLFRLMTPSLPQGRIYLFGQHTSLERGASSDELWRAGDQVVVTLEGEPGTFATLLLLDSHDRLVIPDAGAVNRPLAGGAQQLEIKKVFDQEPGRERFLGIISRTPVSDLPGLIERLNAQPDTRAARLAALASALGADAAVVPAAELEHR